MMTADEIRDGLRDGTVVFCLPAAHENFTNAFLEDFSQRILHQCWSEVAVRTHMSLPALLDQDASEEDLVAAIESEYGVDVTDLPGLPLWEVIRRCALPAAC